MNSRKRVFHWTVLGSTRGSASSWQAYQALKRLFPGWLASTATKSLYAIARVHYTSPNLVTYSWSRGSPLAGCCKQSVMNIMDKFIFFVLLRKYSANKCFLFTECINS